MTRIELTPSINSDPLMAQLGFGGSICVLPEPD